MSGKPRPTMVRRVSRHLRREGWLLREIGELFGVSDTTVSYWCCDKKRLEQNIRTREHYRKNYKPTLRTGPASAIVRRIASHLYQEKEEKWSYSAIGKVLGYSVSTIRCWLDISAKTYQKEYQRKNRGRNLIYHRVKSIAYRSKKAGLPGLDFSAGDIERTFPDGKLLCDLCGLSVTNKSSLHIDHDHSTGNFRGFLCRECNMGLGTVEKFLSKNVGLQEIGEYLSVC